MRIGLFASIIVIFTGCANFSSQKAVSQIEEKFEIMTEDHQFQKLSFDKRDRPLFDELKRCGFTLIKNSKSPLCPGGKFSFIFPAQLGFYSFHLGGHFLVPFKSKTKSYTLLATYDGLSLKNFSIFQITNKNKSIQSFVQLDTLIGRQITKIKGLEIQINSPNLNDPAKKEKVDKFFKILPLWSRPILQKKLAYFPIKSGQIIMPTKANKRMYYAIIACGVYHSYVQPCLKKRKVALRNIKLYQDERSHYVYYKLQGREKYTLQIKTNLDFHNLVITSQLLYKTHSISKIVSKKLRPVATFHLVNKDPLLANLNTNKVHKKNSSTELVSAIVTNSTHTISKKNSHLLTKLLEFYPKKKADSHLSALVANRSTQISYPAKKVLSKYAARLKGWRQAVVQSLVQDKISEKVQTEILKGLNSIYILKRDQSYEFSRASGIGIKNWSNLNHLKFDQTALPYLTLLSTELKSDLIANYLQTDIKKQSQFRKSHILDSFDQVDSFYSNLGLIKLSTDEKSTIKKRSRDILKERNLSNSYLPLIKKEILHFNKKKAYSENAGYHLSLLGKIGTEKSAQAITLLSKNQDYKIRKSAIDMLSTQNQNWANIPLLKFLTEPRASHRAGTLVTLISRDLPAGLEKELIAQIQSTKLPKQEEAILLFEKFPTTSSANFLTRYFNKGKNQHRINVIKALSSNTTVRANQILIRYSLYPHKQLRELSTNTLKGRELTKKVVMGIPSHINKINANFGGPVIDILEKYPIEQKLSSLIKFLRLGGDAMKIQASKQLKTTSNFEVNSTLIQYLTSFHKELRLTVHNILMTRKLSSDELKLVNSNVNFKSSRGQSLIIELLAKSKTKEAIATLERYKKNHQNKKIRKKAKDELIYLSLE
ncbi:MAG: hypothetical protein HOE90_23980 [Bacteriovoracaceae bacterium]|jgi:hypothetical protein|nr:hypothetical protein [Bacteriovoracaceae bacterium]